jgi:manganese efflux pump family protein
VIGWVAGTSLIGLLSAYDHWIAFLLLAIVGGKMIWEGTQGDEEEVPLEIIRPVAVIILWNATSIDALAVGVSFGFLKTAVLVPALTIGIVCCVISYAGVMLGEQLETFLGSKMEIIGGRILILTGIKILMSTSSAECMKSDFCVRLPFRVNQILLRCEMISLLQAALHLLYCCIPKNSPFL